MTARDWRDVAPATVAPWLDAERIWWSSALAWDTQDNWQAIESARSAGTLPGFVLFNGPTVVGWSFHHLHRSTLQIGGVSAVTPAAAGKLLDAMLASPEAGRADTAMAFLPEAGPGLAEEFRARGFAIRPFRYLHCSVYALDGAQSGRPFQVAHLPKVADLLSRAYPGADPERPFAPSGASEDWLDYTARLVAQTGCGTLVPGCSLIADQPGRSNHLVGAVLTTRIGPGTGHLAQVAVDPAWQGQGLGGRLLRAALARLQARGFARASLLVADGNAVAIRLYRDLGFERTGTFLSAWRAQPRRSTSAACSTGGVSTFR